MKIPNYSAKMYAIKMVSVLIFGVTSQSHFYVSSFTHYATNLKKASFISKLSVSSEKQAGQCQDEGESIWDLNSNVFDDTWIKNDIEKVMAENDFMLDKPVLGPNNVLIYDTTLRGKLFF